MVSDKEAIKKLLENFPKFAVSWEEYIDLFGRDSGVCGNMAAFSHFIIESIENKNIDPSELQQVFIFMEELLVIGEDSVQDAVATCFLENLINATSWNTIPASSFVQFLGKESKAYCKAWDEFTGVKTEGLWSDN
jgi:hypothetical protein